MNSEHPDEYTDPVNETETVEAVTRRLAQECIVLEARVQELLEEKEAKRPTGFHDVQHVRSEAAKIAAQLLRGPGGPLSVAVPGSADDIIKLATYITDMAKDFPQTIVGGGGGGSNFVGGATRAGGANG